MAKEKDITSIRIPKTVKDDLKNVSLEKEPYHATIQRLINENLQLKKTNANNEYLIDLLRKNTEDINVFYKAWEFLHQVIDEYAIDSRYSFRLITAVEVKNILANKDKSYDEKIDALDTVFFSDDNDESFVDALEYILSESEYYDNTLDVELIMDFAQHRLNNSPYKKSGDEHKKYVALFSKIV